jgi:chitosanase
MSFTKKQKAAVKALVSCHETGKPIGNYSSVAVLTDGAGISYGIHQATHKSGSLYKIVNLYCQISTSPTAKALAGYLAFLRNPAKANSPHNRDTKLESLLKSAGAEQAMRYAQDKVFAQNYFEPAMRAVETSKWVTALALAVVYDSMIQGGWATLRDRVKASSEKEWIKQYVAVRRNWLANSKKAIVRGTVYRMATFEELIKNNNWSLNVPFFAHGVQVTEAHLEIWMAADDPTAQPIIAVAPVTPMSARSPEIKKLMERNTEGIAEEDDASDDETAAADPESGNLADSSVLHPTPDEASETLPESNVEEDGAKAGEPAPDVPAKEDEAVVGGRPNDPPVIVPKVAAEPPTGWKTWKTTITGVIGTAGISAASAFSWFVGAIKDPTSSKFILAVSLVGLLLAAIFGIIYLIIRAVTSARREKQAHEIALKELELHADPTKYNVKLDRRSESRPENTEKTV